MEQDVKEKIMREIDYALGGDVVGFVGVVITIEDGRAIPTVIDISHSDFGKLNSERVRARFRDLGKAIAAECDKLCQAK